MVSGPDGLAELGEFKTKTEQERQESKQSVIEAKTGAKHNEIIHPSKTFDCKSSVLNIREARVDLSKSDVVSQGGSKGTIEGGRSFPVAHEMRIAR